MEGYRSEGYTAIPVRAQEDPNATKVRAVLSRSFRTDFAKVLREQENNYFKARKAVHREALDHRRNYANAWGKNAAIDTDKSGECEALLRNILAYMHGRQWGNRDKSAIPGIFLMLLADQTDFGIYRDKLSRI